MHALDQATLRALVHYDPDSGAFTWLRREEIDGNVRQWNARYAGKQIVSKNGHGYIQISITIGGVKKRYEVHRLAWLYVYGKLPPQLDHEDRVKINNRIKNLRVSTTSLNGHNVGLTKRNSSGVKGVYWHKAARKWHVSIALGGEETYLGLFTDLDAAKAAYAAASLEYAKEFSIHAREAA